MTTKQHYSSNNTTGIFTLLLEKPVNRTIVVMAVKRVYINQDKKTCDGMKTVSVDLLR